MVPDSGRSSPLPTLLRSQFSKEAIPVEKRGVSPTLLHTKAKISQPPNPSPPKSAREDFLRKLHAQLVEPTEEIAPAPALTPAPVIVSLADAVLPGSQRAALPLTRTKVRDTLSAWDFHVGGEDSEEEYAYMQQRNGFHGCPQSESGSDDVGCRQRWAVKGKGQGGSGTAQGGAVTQSQRQGALSKDSLAISLADVIPEPIVPVMAAVSAVPMMPAQDNNYAAQSENSEEHDPEHSSNGTSTTIMIRNLPQSLTQQRLIEELDLSGYRGEYDFCYMPRSFTKPISKGFAFVNFEKPQRARDFIKHWKGSRRFCAAEYEQAVNLSFACIQGLEANLAKWNVARMHRVRNPNLRPFVGPRAEALIRQQNQQNLVKL